MSRTPSRGVIPGHPTTSPSPRAASVCEGRCMLLHAERDGAGPPIVLVHGFTQTGRCWGPEAEDLARDHEVIRVDAPGHGRSADVLAGLRPGGRLIPAPGRRPTYLGHSTGSRFSPPVPPTHPEPAARPVLHSR